MDDLRLEGGKKSCVIIAHPDDETIWMGGSILTNPQVDWTVFSLCRASDKDREPKFWKVCKHLSVKGIISDFDDENEIDFDKGVKLIEDIIADKIGAQDFDYIFTHFKNGEYGHDRHCMVHEAVKNLLDKGKLKPETVFYFAYRKNLEGLKPLILSRKDAEIIVKLEDKVYKEKRRIVAEMYGYPYDGLDVGYCTNPEAFIKRR